MGSFFEEILKGGLGSVLGSVFGGGSSSSGGGGLEDIIKSVQEQMGGGSSSSSTTTSSGGGASDIVKEMQCIFRRYPFTNSDDIRSLGW